MRPRSISAQIAPSQSGARRSTNGEPSGPKIEENPPPTMSNYAWKPEADGKVGIDLTADILIKTATGSVMLDQKGFLHLASDFASKIKTIDMVANVALADSLAATRYVMTITVHDEVGKKTTSVDLPFSIVEP